MNPAHLLRYVIAEALLHISRVEPRLDGPVPRALLLGTAMIESGLKHLQQLNGGPAMGLWQCEPRTHAPWAQGRLVWVQRGRYVVAPPQ